MSWTLMKKYKSLTLRFNYAQKEEEVFYLNYLFCFCCLFRLAALLDCGWPVSLRFKEEEPSSFVADGSAKSCDLSRAIVAL